ncbi:polysaccharide biosynthesis/export family protein [Mesorhizobium sp. WSM3224]|uniref:polysaccharide biosynthesis/export family protein n=1 Tax=Mesorhizobium sp. WSM3224 TaxID=1040986 RepID=UPI000425B1AD|nr:polysaccharide biosynthesis/export family protein [Mesorhizobium sp. WSM3224]
MSSNPIARLRHGRLAAALLASAAYMFFAVEAQAADYRLAAQTKIHISIIQWNPSKGEYQRWEALSGDFLVSNQGTIGLPVVGSLDVGGRTNTEVAAQISAALHDKMGLISPPEVSVEIAQYPSIYVVGAVTTPGAYQFRPDLTVLQAVALAGGRYRPPLEKAGQGGISLLGELTTIRTKKLRLLGRIARLQAELSGDAEIRFPAELTSNDAGDVAGQVMALERSLFTARASEKTRQVEKLSDLRNMYTNELNMLASKSKDSGEEIAQTETEVAKITKLVEQGIVTSSRWAELRRVLGQMRAEHAQGDIEAMRARQGLSETTRQEFSISDQRQTEAATQLRDAQSELTEARTREYTIRQLLLADSTVVPGAPSDGNSDLKLVIVRQDRQGPKELSASETTPLAPGDVVKVYVASSTQDMVNPATPQPRTGPQAGGETQ